MNKGIFILTVFWMAVFMECKHEPLTSPGGTVVVTPTDTTQTPVDTTKKVDSSQYVGVPCNTDTAYFTDVLPLYVSYCASGGCHDAGSRRSGYQLTDYTHIVSGVSKGNPNGSPVYTAIATGRMPPGQSVSATQLALIKKWITQGALNNSCNPNYGVCDTTAVKFSADIMPVIQNSCVGCHGTSNPGGGISLTNYAQVKASVTSGRFYGSLIQASGYYAMPLNGSKLSSCELNKINAWIKRGALNN